MTTVLETPLNLSAESNNYVRHAQGRMLLNFQAGCSVYSSNDNVPQLVAPIPLRYNSTAAWSEVSPLSSEVEPSALSAPKTRGPKHPVPEELKDDKYFKRRRRNNEAAKRSRRARRERQREDLQRIEIAEMENTALTSQVVRLRAEYDTLAQLIARRHLLHHGVILQASSGINHQL